MSHLSSDTRVLLVDAMALIYRAHFALMGRVSNTTGNQPYKPIVVGFFNSVMEGVNRLKPSHVVVAFDTPEPTWRSKHYSAYKAHREAAPEAISEAIPVLHELLAGLGMTYIEQAGYEADDLMGTLSVQVAQAGGQVFLMSTDKDLGQLVQKEHVFWYKPGRLGQQAHLIDSAQLCVDWGIQHPQQLIDLLALWGDASDNIPGVPGIGRKGAQKLINEWQSLDNLLENTDKLPPKLSAKLNGARAQATLSKQLVTIDCAVPLTWSWLDAQYHPPEPAAGREICKKWGLYQLAKRLFPPPNDTKKERVGKWGADYPLFNQSAQAAPALPLLDTPVKLQAFIDTLLNQPTPRLFVRIPAPAENIPVGSLLLSSSAEETSYLIKGARKGRFSDLLRQLFRHVPQVVGYQLKAVMHLLDQSYNCPIQAPLVDLAVAHHLLAPDQPSGWENLLAYWRPIGNPLPKPADPLKNDALLIAQCMQKALTEKGMQRLFEELEMPLIPVLFRMEQVGVFVDPHLLNSHRQTLTKQLAQLEKKIYALAGTTAFQINSPKQLGELLFGHLKLLEKPIKTKSGQYATSEAVLAPLAQREPIVRHLLNYRGLRKLNNTYLEAFPKYIDPIDQRIHTQYQQTVVSTGRLSSTQPNLQNIPIRRAEGRLIRSAFAAQKKATCLLTADYSQIELRLLADRSQDPVLLESFRKGLDVHRQTAARIFDVAEEQVSAEQRREAKTVNFGIIYGISSYGLSKTLSCSRKKAQGLIDAYFEQFSHVKTYLEQARQEAYEKGYITTPAGRRRVLPHIRSRNTTMRRMAERFAINMPLQGHAAEIIKRAMIQLDRWLLEHPAYGARLILQIHDELLIELPQKHLSPIQTALKQIMENSSALSVPLQVHIGVGKNWGAAK